MAPAREAILAGWAAATLAFSALSIALILTGRRCARLFRVIPGSRSERPSPAATARTLLDRVAGHRRTHRRRKGLDAGCEEVIVEIAEALRAGESLLQAIIRARGGAPAPWADLLGDVLARYERGVPLVEALGLLARTGSRPALLLARATEISLRAGGNLPEALLKLAQGVREEQLLHREMRAKTAEARWTAYCVAATPGLLAAYFLAGAPDLLAPLLTDPIGRVGLLYALISWLAGILILRRLTTFNH